jgi:3-dehydroquinate synthase
VHVVHVATEPRYEVRIGPGLLADVDRATSEYSRRAVLSDEHVAALYRSKLGLAGDVPSLAVPPGEDSKSFGALERVLDFMAECGLDRRSCLIALGGGVVGDLGGLAAALYMRGIALVSLPTTLLAQVDASVGGKNAINLERGKNLAGTFHQPALVLADTDTLATLSDEEYRSGLGEVVKSALIEGEAALAFLERNADAIVARDRERLAEIVAVCVRTKATIVARDPREHGERKSLNLGHTFAHAIEHAAGYGTIPHGVAVGVGLLLALSLSRELGVSKDATLAERVRDLFLRLGMPASLDALRHSSRAPLTADEIVSGTWLDKKGSAGKPRFVLIEAPGKLALDVEASVAVLGRCLAEG